jgi:hypothetical protein
MQKLLDKLKALISELLVRALPETGETLLLYNATTTQVISAALVVERRNPGTSTRCKGRSITLARSSPDARFAIIRYKSYFMPS